MSGGNASRKLPAQFDRLDRGTNLFVCELFAADRPRRVWYCLACAKQATSDQLADGRSAYIKDSRSGADGNCAITVALGIKRRDAIMIPQRVDSRLHPGIPCSGAIAKAIEHTCDLRIRKSSGEFSHDLDYLAIRGMLMLASSILAHV